MRGELGDEAWELRAGVWRGEAREGEACVVLALLSPLRTMGLGSAQQRGRLRAGGRVGAASGLHVREEELEQVLLVVAFQARFLEGESDLRGDAELVGAAFHGAGVVGVVQEVAAVADRA